MARIYPTRLQIGGETLRCLQQYLLGGILESQIDEAAHHLAHDLDQLDLPVFAYIEGIDVNSHCVFFRLIHTPSRRGRMCKRR